MAGDVAAGGGGVSVREWRQRRRWQRRWWLWWQWLDAESDKLLVRDLNSFACVLMHGRDDIHKLR